MQVPLCVWTDVLVVVVWAVMLGWCVCAGSHWNEGPRPVVWRNLVCMFMFG